MIAAEEKKEEEEEERSKQAMNKVNLTAGGSHVSGGMFSIATSQLL